METDRRTEAETLTSRARVAAWGAYLIGGAAAFVGIWICLAVLWEALAWRPVDHQMLVAGLVAAGAGAGAILLGSLLVAAAAAVHRTMAAAEATADALARMRAAARQHPPRTPAPSPARPGGSR